MTKSTSCIYLIPLHPIFNEKEIRVFDSFTRKDSALLYSALYLNSKELTVDFSPLIDTIFCFDGTDQDYILPEFSGLNKIFTDVNDKSVLIKTLSEKYFSLYSNNLIIFANTMGISQNDIIKYLDLLNREDESFIIGKSHNDKVSYIGFNIYNSELFYQIESTDLNFDNLLHLVCRFDYFVNVLNGSLFIEDSNDFKTLFRKLSGKESLNYCSHSVNELLTHLFIEYKELLK